MASIPRFCIIGPVLLVILLSALPGGTQALEITRSHAASAAPPDAAEALACPDVDGYLCRLSPGPDGLSGAGPLRTIDVYPNWPRVMSGRNNRGGVCVDLDGDGELETVYTGASSVYAWKLDGSLVAGWPRTTSGASDGAPAYGDVDGDGVGEIVVTTKIGTGNTGMLYVFNPDGSVPSPFPIALNGGATKTPTLGDVDGDGVLDIAVEERAYPIGYVCVYKGDGTELPGWPQPLDYVPGSAAAVGDITGDGIPEVVAESYYSIYAYDAQGNLLSGFPVTPGNSRVFSYASPVLADLDGDGQREILCGDHSTGSGNGAVHVLRSDGTPLPGWPRYTANWIYGPASVGDIDGDGDPDVAVGDQVLSGSPADYAYAWNAEGFPLPGFPIGPIWAINSQILLADLDGDDQVELMFDDNTSLNRYMGYNHDGTPMDGWPIYTNGTTFFINPLATDVDGDGELDLSGGGYLDGVGTSVYLWDAHVPVNAAKNYLTVLQYDPQHSGVYLGVDPAGVTPRGEGPGRVALAVGPNPFVGATTIRLAMAAPLGIYALDGRLVRELPPRAAGDAVVWDGRDARGQTLPAGAYWCVARGQGAEARRRVVLLR
jgi:hypothetical protein